jgi:hypothetical protein
VNVTGEGHAILRCTLYNGGRSILVHRKLRKGRIERNHMYNAGLMCRDLGMTYTYHTDGEGTTIAWNRIHHNYAGGWGCVGIYLDDWSRNHLVHHNVVYKVSEALALNPPKSRGNKIYHNTLAGFRASVGMSTRRPQDLTGTVFRNNIFTQKLPKRMPNVTMGRNLTHRREPKFVAPKKFDFRLDDGSPAIDAGERIEGVNDDFLGDAPDHGALEHGREPFECGSSLPGAQKQRPSPVPWRWDDEEP